jgi:hypothetical protein
MFFLFYEHNGDEIKQKYFTEGSEKQFGICIGQTGCIMIQWAENIGYGNGYPNK